MTLQLTEHDLDVLRKMAMTSAVTFQGDNFNSHALTIVTDVDAKKSRFGFKIKPKRRSLTIEWDRIASLKVLRAAPMDSTTGVSTPASWAAQVLATRPQVEITDVAGEIHRFAITSDRLRRLVAGAALRATPPAIFADDEFIIADLLGESGNDRLRFDKDKIRVRCDENPDQSNNSSSSRIKTIPWDTIFAISIEKGISPSPMQDWHLVVKDLSGQTNIRLADFGNRGCLDYWTKLAKFHGLIDSDFLPEYGNLPNSSKPYTIPLWPYTDADIVEQDNEIRQATALIAPFLVLCLASLPLWFGALYLPASFLHVFGNVFWAILRVCPKLLFLLPVFAFWIFKKGSSTARLRCDPDAIRCESVVAGDVSLKRQIRWNDIAEIRLTPPRNNQRLLDREICFTPKHGRTLRLKLETIATSQHWTELLEAIRVFYTGNVNGLDPDLFNHLSIDQKDPTYTRLWLDALLAPPRREKLQALTGGAVLNEGEYTIEKRLGTGGQGSAYLAHTRSGQKVVLKEYILPLYVDSKVRRQALETFEHEATILRSLDNPYIVKLLDCFVEDHRGYLVLEHIDGLNLREHVAKSGPLHAATVRALALIMCDMLSCLHDSSPPIVHRDFTPDNLLICADGSLKLIDFMVAQQNTDTATATVVGKHAYLPPEQFRGKATPQSDIYALGCTLNFLLTGHDAQPLTTSHPMLEQPLVDADMDAIVAKATQQELAMRYASAQALREALLNTGPDAVQHTIALAVRDLELKES